MHELRDGNLDFKSQRPLRMPVILLRSASLPTWESRLCLETSTKSGLVEIVPLTSEVVAKMRAVGAEAVNVVEAPVKKTV